MKKKKSNVKEQISQTTYFYKGKEAKKRWYSWDEDQSKNGAWHEVEAASVKERLEYILSLAKERGFVLTKCRLEFNKIPDENSRKEVEFQLDAKSGLEELGFKEE